MKFKGILRHPLGQNNLRNTHLLRRQFHFFPLTRQLICTNTVDTLRTVRRRHLFYFTDKKMKFVVYFTFIRNLFARLQDRTHCVERIGFLSEPKNSAIDLFFV